MENLIKKCSYTFTNNVTVVNCTGHPVCFLDHDNEITIPCDPSMVIETILEEVEIPDTVYIMQVRKLLESSEELIDEIWELLSDNEEVVIIGSKEASLAAPMQVFCARRIEGTELMTPEKFDTYYTPDLC